MNTSFSPEDLSALERGLLAAAQGPVVEEGGTLRQRFVLQPDNLCFTGHFPGHPLLPAFVQLMLGRLVAGTLVKGHGVDRAKFTAPIPPGEVTVTCEPRRVGLRVCLETEKGQAALFTFVPESELEQ